MANREDEQVILCQREAAETLIWLAEAHPADRQGLQTESVDGERISLERAHEPFLRYCCKMATGTGKTVVMTMLIAWQTLNKAQYPQDTRFTDAFLVLAPGVTVKNRLQVLMPESDGNYYQLFDLVPAGLRSLLSKARVCILHRQELAIQDDTKNRSVRKLGPESDSAFANRLLMHHLGSTNRILVLNDEGHHCYKPRMKSVEERDEEATGEEKKENERAAQWITGLEKINNVRQIVSCVDFSATPFFIHGSGYPLGRPFPWIVSDFGLIDAIESGLVKIPVLPVDDNKSAAKGPPAYFHLWKWVNEQLAAQDRYKQLGRGKGNPIKIAEKAEPAAVTMIGNWKRTFDAWQAAGSVVPPCMIVVCQDTDVSAEMFKMLTRTEFDFDQFVNKPGQEISYLYDSKTLKDVEKAEEGETVKEREIRLRDVLNTVGKEGQPGEQVRMVCSVSMLTEGWDANNVTQIIGLRAFTSQLLCEQVVGRALRRRSYEVNPETGLLEPEEAEIYGVPFQVIPVKARKVGPGPPPPSFLVKSLPERREEFEITFPRVEGYVTELRDTVVCDWKSVPRLKADRSIEPLEVAGGAVAGYLIGKPEAVGVTEVQNRVPYYTVARMQPAIFKIAETLVADRIAKGKENADKRAKLFPQILNIVRKYVSEFITLGEMPAQELTLLNWQSKIVSALNQHIHAADRQGEPIVLPRIERYRENGSTRSVMFRTSRAVLPTAKSHVSHVVVDTQFWEKWVTQSLEKCKDVQSFARNDHLDFTIPYLDPAA